MSEAAGVKPVGDGGLVAPTWLFAPYIAAMDGPGVLDDLGPIAIQVDQETWDFCRRWVAEHPEE